MSEEKETTKENRIAQVEEKIQQARNGEDVDLIVLFADAENYGRISLSGKEDAPWNPLAVSGMAVSAVGIAQELTLKTAQVAASSTHALDRLTENGAQPDPAEESSDG